VLKKELVKQKRDLSAAVKAIREEKKKKKKSSLTMVGKMPS